MNELEQQGQAGLAAGDYAAAIDCFERAVEAEPGRQDHYWYLGLAYALDARPEDAREAWMWGAFASDLGLDEEAYARQLGQFLEHQARLQQQRDRLLDSWRLREQLRDLQPDNAENLLRLLELSVVTNLLTVERVRLWEIDRVWSQIEPGTHDSTRIIAVMQEILLLGGEQLLDVARSARPHLAHPEDFEALLGIVAHLLAFERGRFEQGLALLEAARQQFPENLKLLQYYIQLCRLQGQYERAVELAGEYCQRASTPVEARAGTYALLRALLSAGAWQDVDAAVSQHDALRETLLQQPPGDFSLEIHQEILQSTLVDAYWKDCPQVTLPLRCRAARRFQAALDPLPPHLPPLDRSGAYERLEKTEGLGSEETSNLQTPRQVTAPRDRRPLRIGYIGSTFRQHSVGWLCRWLLAHHDREQFHLRIYISRQPEDALTQKFRNSVDAVYRLDRSPRAAAEQIRRSEVDILVDLDSLTLDLTSRILAYKPAPIQATWLGWDASELPAIDYFFADPYVLPDNAQQYYSETLWRLPKTYIAVSGFEIGVPTLRRSDLGLPDEAIIFFSAQSGQKRHPNLIRQQLRILRAVPDSYLLLKGLGSSSIVESLFVDLAREEGVDPQRLRFLPRDPNEEIHRANLEIADVVLDTYPYNGATTTLEVLWQGIPLVTRVGEQFAARNSYTFLVNAGVSEGIAWSDEEYVQWGVKFGTDPDLRSRVRAQLWQSRRRSPLWNARQFARDMEEAYRQMWSNYVSSKREK